MADHQAFLLHSPSFRNATQEAVLVVLDQVSGKTKTIRVVESVLDWCLHKLSNESSYPKEQLRRMMDPFLKKIHFLTLTSEEFFSSSAICDILSEDEICQIGLNLDNELKGPLPDWCRLRNTYRNDITSAHVDSVAYCTVTKEPGYNFEWLCEFTVDKINDRNICLEKYLIQPVFNSSYKTQQIYVNFKGEFFENGQLVDTLFQTKKVGFGSQSKTVVFSFAQPKQCFEGKRYKIVINTSRVSELSKTLANYKNPITLVSENKNVFQVSITNPKRDAAWISGLEFVIKPN